MVGARNLGGFTGKGYDKQRPWVMQACWFACSNMVFRRWWLPARFRPYILRAFGAQIGTSVLIRHDVRILWPWKLSVGDRTWIGESAWLLNLEPIRIGSDVCISQSAYLITGSHDRRSPTFEYDNGPITVEDGSWIAVRATVLRRVNIGRGATVGAGVVLSRSIGESECVTR